MVYLVFLFRKLPLAAGCMEGEKADLGTLTVVSTLIIDNCCRYGVTQVLIIGPDGDHSFDPDAQKWNPRLAFPMTTLISFHTGK